MYHLCSDAQTIIATMKISPAYSMDAYNDDATTLLMEPLAYVGIVYVVEVLQRLHRAAQLRSMTTYRDFDGGKHVERMLIRSMNRSASENSS